MAFWLGILVAAIFAWAAIRIGFYETWGLLFNLLISIYLAIFLRPIILNNIPAVADTTHSNPLIMLVTAITSFLILYGISYTLLNNRSKIVFPKIFDILGTGVLGFAAGFLVWSFVNLLICLTPLSQAAFAKKINLSDQFEQISVPYISMCCNLVNTVVSSADSRYTTEQAISDLLGDVKRKAQRDKQAETDDPNRENIDQKNLLGPPPEPEEIEDI